MYRKQWWIPIILILFIATIITLVVLFPTTSSAEKAKKTYGTLKDDSESYSLDYDKDLVREIQRAVNAYMKKHSKNWDSISVDGDFGPGTANAVKQFQHKKGLKADGICGPNTLKALGIDSSDVTVYPRWMPNLEEEFDKKSSNGRALHLNLGSRRLEAYEKIDGKWKLVRVMKAAIGDIDEGNFTPLVCRTLSGSGHSAISGTNSRGKKWAADDAVEFKGGGYYFHSILRWQTKKGWDYDDNSALGKAVTHGCVRLSRNNAKWVKSFVSSGTACVIDDRSWRNDITHN